MRIPPSPLDLTVQAIKGLAGFLLFPLGGAFPPLVGWLILLAVLVPFGCVLGLLGVGQ